MIVIRDDILIVTIASSREGAQMRAEVRFVDTTLGLQSSYARSMPPADYGMWLHALLVATGGKQTIRLRLDDGVITGIGNRTDEQWFDPRAPNEIGVARSYASRVDRALRHINAHRASYGHRPLDRSTWLDDDVITEAKRLRWSDET